MRIENDLIIEFEDVEVNGAHIQRVDGYRGRILSFMALTDLRCDEVLPHAVVLQTFPNFGEVVEVPIHKIKVLTPNEINARPCLRVI